MRTLSYRWLLCAPLLVFGILYFTRILTHGVLLRNQSAGDTSWICLLAGVLLISAAVAIGMKKFDRMAALGAAILLSLTAAVLYAPNLGSQDEFTRVSSMLHMFKDMALAGAALSYAGLTSVKM